MADAAKIGTEWGDSELDAIVGDYFEMLAETYRADGHFFVGNKTGAGAFVLNRR